MKMQELSFSIGAQQGRVQVIIPEELRMPVTLSQLLVKAVCKFKDGTFIGYGMCMCNSTFITRFGKDHTAGIRVHGMPEHIVQEITLAYKADTKAFRILRLGSTAICAPAFKIQYTVKVGMVAGMDVSVHGCEVNQLPPEGELRNEQDKLKKGLRFAQRSPF